MNQYETSMPAVSFRIIWRMVARQSSNALSQSLSGGATCADDVVATVRVSVNAVMGMTQAGEQPWDPGAELGEHVQGPFLVRQASATSCCR